MLQLDVMGQILRAVAICRPIGPRAPSVLAQLLADPEGVLRAVGAKTLRPVCLLQGRQCASVTQREGSQRGPVHLLALYCRELLSANAGSGKPEW